ncbi:uncharacterized protein LOC119610957 [Lucilia sericata]|uniref:uncharacterized protein LOC119610957 n=1 Tax=Lucilia sericata TaxID=13632 RepID=UPI0018A85618|nr:uncharacterized protein LOC119610957 [Lucilia sericata]
MPKASRFNNVAANREYLAETNYNVTELQQEEVTAHSSLTNDQQVVYDQVISSIECQLETPICNISKQSNLAYVLKQCKLIVWDESTMAHKCGFEALNRSLKDIRSNNDIMGGFTVLLAGDFRQTLPVVPRGTIADEVKACIKSSNLWQHTLKLSPHENMRVHLRGDNSAAQFSEISISTKNQMTGYVNVQS